jgi:hypothetical protein
MNCTANPTLTGWGREWETEPDMGTEWLMGRPLAWTDLGVLETVRSRHAPQKHGGYCDRIENQVNES